MTLGERIQSLRKEKGISQESLGELLGVTRQSISKWESDITVPELDKLIALSKVFGIPIGVLLGLEEGEATKELTDRELAALEAIAARLQPPSPQAEPVRRKRRWPKVVAAIFCVVAGYIGVTNWTQNMEYLIDNLYTKNIIMEERLTTQIGNISDQVENILVRQNAVTADEECTLVHLDLKEMEAHYNLSAVPRDYVEGMTALFTAQSDGEVVTSQAEFSEVTKTFTGTIACPLTNDITISVAFQAHGQTQTRVLKRSEYLLEYSYPEAYGNVPLWLQPVGEEGTFFWSDPSMDVHWFEGEGMEHGESVYVTVESAELRLWKNRALVELGEVEFEKDSSMAEWSGAEGMTFTDLREGTTLYFTALCTDNYGRTFECFLEGFVVKDGRLEFHGEPENTPW